MIGIDGVVVVMMVVISIMLMVIGVVLMDVCVKVKM